MKNLASKVLATMVLCGSFALMACSSTTTGTTDTRFDRLEKELAETKALVAQLVERLSEDRADADAVSESGDGSVLFSEGALYMEVPEIQADVAKSDGGRARVQFGLLIRFDGTQDQQLAAKEALSEESKPLVIAAQAVQLMKGYDVRAAQDANFTERFAFALTKHLNTMIQATPHKVKHVVVHPFRVIG